MLHKIVQNFPELAKSFRYNAKIKNWFDLDCRAEILFRPKNIEELSIFLKNYRNKNEIKIIGATSNIIFKDNVIKGVIIKLPKYFSDISHNDSELSVGCSALCQNLALYCAINNLGNLEFYSGIPGSIGGAIAMNAGCYGSETANFLQEVTAISYQGNIEIIPNSDFNFKYRSNAIAKKANKIFLMAKYKVAKCEEGVVEKKIRDLKDKRKQAQPISAKTGGSTFKNPPKQKAWELIDGANCRGLSCGDAQISTKHCNFLINNSKASAQDLLNLIKLVKKKVYSKYGIKLEEEIKIY